MARKTSRCINTTMFDSLKKDDDIRVRFMGKATVVGGKCMKAMHSTNSDMSKYDHVIVKFLDGAWKDRELEIIRQQIEKIL